MGAKGMKALSQALKINRTITKLNLYYNSIGDEGIISIRDVLKKNHTLTKLDLAHNEIGSKGSKSIGEALKINQTLTKLDLSENQINAKGVKYLSEALKVNQTLTQLNLSENKIGSKGIKTLSEALKVNQTLTKLNLDLNGIGDKEIEEVGELPKKNQSVTELELDSNQIQDNETKDINEVLRVNQTLTKLDLSSDNQIRDNLIKEEVDKNIQEFIQSLKINKSIINLNIDFGFNEEDLNKLEYLIKRNINFQKKLIKSAQEGNLQLFKQLIQIEKVPLICQSSDIGINNKNNKGENSIFQTAIFHNQIEFLFYLLFANNEKTDFEIISKRNLLLNLKNPKTKKSAIDLLNPNKILIQDFENYYNQFISTSSSSSSSLTSSFFYFNNNEKSNNFPNKLIAEEEIMLMRIGKEWKTIKNEFKNELTKKQKQLFLKWLYCPVSLNFKEKQIILEIFKLLNIIQFEKQNLFSNKKLLNDFQNYIKKYTNSEKKNFSINLKKKKKKQKNENQNDNFKIKSIQINKFILCLRSNLFREMILQTFPIQLKIEKEKEMGKEKEKLIELEMGREKENEKIKEKEKEKEKKKTEKQKKKKNEIEIEIEKSKEKVNRSINQVTDYFSSIDEFYPFFLLEFYNINLTPFTFTFDNENKTNIDNNNNNSNHKNINSNNDCNNNNNKQKNNIQKIENNNNYNNQNNNIDIQNNNHNNNKKKNTTTNNNKPETKNNFQKSSEQIILTIKKAKTILKTFNQNNFNNLINFFLERDVYGFYQTNGILFIYNLFIFSQKLSKCKI
ncbi:nlr family card domain-containing protein [Anaeramoeba flamelloides]|uniref:Nlr family card domain-containing protein n=1 Tax=Anaeramoeba flamelloides TaxID=1746091 RepID=A0ABQ8Z0A5_9EUKA|nr:nlr family card domain-containing protein [Anaeramoeba flamelloides]